MNVFADLHHAALFYSLQLLFEKRLGAKLYRPIGVEWWEQKYWHVYEHPSTVEQFLGLHQGSKEPVDVHGNPLLDVQKVNLHYTVEDGIYYVKDLANEVTHRAVTLEKFKDMKFDILISSIPRHIGPFNELVARYQPQAKHIFQIGNAWGCQQGVRNILASTTPFSVSPDINLLCYHQEFDTDLFCYEPPSSHNSVNSYIHFMRNSHLMDEYAQQLPGWQFTRYGGGMDMALTTMSEVSSAIKQSAFTWHYKPEGDGYGHTVHSSYACGRPAIVWGEFYRGKLAEQLFTDGVTCIDASQHSFAENLALIKRFSQPEEHVKMCEAAHNRFQHVVDFDAEFEQIKAFLNNLL